MAKNIFVFLLISYIIAGCNTAEKPPRLPESKKDTLAIFPVTDYLLGQIATIETLQTTPVKIVGSEAHYDSVWISREDVKQLATPFLEPYIDSASLQKYFTGNSFLDQTINAFTFTYAPKPNVENNMGLRELNVYVDPNSSKVERIYIVKEKGDTTLQLTWKSDYWFTIRKIIKDQVQEEKVKWNFSD